MVVLHTVIKARFVTVFFFIARELCVFYVLFFYFQNINQYNKIH